MRYFRVVWLIPVIVSLCACPGKAQSQSSTDEVEQLKQLVFDLQRRVTALEQQNKQLTAAAASEGSAEDAAAALASATTELRVPDPAPQPVQVASVTPGSAAPGPVSSGPVASLLPGTLPGGVTLNYTFDGYYEYNFNQPVGRVNDLRAYNVLSNTFSINQADFIFDLEAGQDPDDSLLSSPILFCKKRLPFRENLCMSFGNPSIFC